MRFLLLLLPLILSSCGTILSGSKDRVNIEAKPDDAKIHVNGKEQGRGKASVKMPKSKQNVIRIQKEGCDNQTHYIEADGGGGILFLDFLLFFPGLFIDLGTGAHKSFNQSVYRYELDCGKQTD